MKLAISFLLLATVAGCMQPAARPVPSGFLTDYEVLQSSDQFPALSIYRDETARRGYDRLLFRPVEVWRGADRRLRDIPEDDLQYLADSLYRAVHRSLAKSFEMVDERGPGVLEIHLALTLVTDENSPIDFFSTVVPVTNIEAKAGALPEATRAFIRNAALEAEFVEPSAGRVRAAMFDARTQGESPKADVETWKDVDRVFARWGGFLESRLSALRAGDFRPVLTTGGRAKR